VPTSPLEEEAANSGALLVLASQHLTALQRGAPTTPPAATALPFTRVHAACLTATNVTRIAGHAASLLPLLR